MIALSMGDAAEDDETANDWSPRAPMIAAMTTVIAMRIVDVYGCYLCWSAVGHASSQGSVVLSARMGFSICRRYAAGR
jgi:hypothetical protein